MLKLFVLVFLLMTVSVTLAQPTKAFADSVRLQYQIPEIAYAVVSADTVLEINISGVQRINTLYAAKPTDRFHIGSNTKAITSLIAALLVQQGKIKWETTIVEMFPEWRTASRKIFHTITLQDLLCFRGKLQPYTYFTPGPTNADFKGDNAQQRASLAKYLLSLPAMKPKDGLTPSNADYVIAGLMLEKASGKPYKELVRELGAITKTDFGFDFPNLVDSLQTWGHDKDLHPVPPFDNYKLNWLLSAGNINVDLQGYCRFAQLLLKGLKGESKVLPQATFNKLLFGLPYFSFGWFESVDPVTQHHIAVNEGNAGAYITRVQVIKETGLVYIVFTNSFTDQTTEGITALVNALQAGYEK